MDIQKIQWLQKIAENQQFRTTWLVEADGVKYIAKKIETDNSVLLLRLIILNFSCFFHVPPLFPVCIDFRR